MKKHFRFLAVILSVISISTILPAAVMAAASGNEIVYGTVQKVDAAKNQVTIKTDSGDIITLDVNGTNMQYGSQKIDISGIKPGQTLGTYGQKSGTTMDSLKLTVMPEEPTYKHLTGVVTENDGGGVGMQTSKGKMTCTDTSGKGKGMGIGKVVTTIIQIPPGVNPDEYVNAALSGSANAKPEITNFQPFSETINNIGQNLKQAPSDSSGASKDFAVSVVNELGAITNNVSGDTKTQLQTEMSKVIGDAMPSTAWTEMNADSGKSLASNGMGFIPSQAFGQMPATTFSQLSPDAVKEMKPEAFGQMKPEAFGQMPATTFSQLSPDAVKEMKPEAFGQMKPEAFGQMKPEAFSQMSPDAVKQMQPADFKQMSTESFNQMSTSAQMQIPAGVTIPTGGGTPPAGGGGTPPAGGGGTPPAGGGGTPPAGGGGTPPAGGGGTPPAGGGGTPPAGGGGTPPAGGGGSPPAGGGGGSPPAGGGGSPPAGGGGGHP
jgi:Cu/Ag efflux protein CusF